jgi:hypothetical protein
MYLQFTLALVLPRRGVGFDPKLVDVRYIVDRVALATFFSKYLGFPLSASFHQYSLLVFIYMLLLAEGRND